MSRFTLICSLVVGLSSASVATAGSSFAKAPPPVSVASSDGPDIYELPQLRVAPMRAPDRAQVRAALVKARAKNLASFRAYWKGRVYPSNTYTDKLLNVWRDDGGHFCAAATIMVKSGNEALAIKLAEDNNFIRLADVEQGPVMDWILSTGFTKEELVQIQRPFMPVANPSDVQPSELPLAVDPAPVVIDAKLRKAETARLFAKYKQIDSKLASTQRANLDRAVERLMAHPALAWTVVRASAPKA